MHHRGRNQGYNEYKKRRPWGRLLSADRAGLAGFLKGTGSGLVCGGSVLDGFSDAPFYVIRQQVVVSDFGRQRVLTNHATAGAVRCGGILDAFGNSPFYAVRKARKVDQLWRKEQVGVLDLNAEAFAKGLRETFKRVLRKPLVVFNALHRRFVERRGAVLAQCSNRPFEQSAESIDVDPWRPIRPWLRISFMHVRGSFCHPGRTGNRAYSPVSPYLCLYEINNDKVPYDA